jgi:hypothetical protein
MGGDRRQGCEVSAGSTNGVDADRRHGCGVSTGSTSEMGANHGQGCGVSTGSTDGRRGTGRGGLAGSAGGDGEAAQGQSRVDAAHLG